VGTDLKRDVPSGVRSTAASPAGKRVNTIVANAAKSARQIRRWHAFIWSGRVNGTWKFSQTLERAGLMTNYRLGICHGGAGFAPGIRLYECPRCDGKLWNDHGQPSRLRVQDPFNLLKVGIG